MGNVEASGVPRSVVRPRQTRFGSIVDRIHELDRLSAADKALTTFLAPKRMVPNRAQRAILSTAKILTHQVEDLSLKVYLWENVPGCPYVLLGHGFMMNAASMLGFVQPLLKAGFSVVAWDQPGHGESEGDSTYVQTWSDAFPVIGQSYQPLAGIIGFSLSGTTAMMALSENQSFECPLLACINSPRQVDTVMLGFLLKHGCSSELLPMMHDAAAIRGWRFPEEDKCFMAQNGGLPQTRCLFIQDQNDTVASENEAKYWARVARNSTLQMTSGLQHQGLLMQPQQIAKIVSYFDKETSLPRRYKIKSKL